MKPTKRLGEIIDFLKNQHGLTNEAISLALNYRTGNYVSDILSGNKLVNKLFLQRLRDVFGVNPDYITGESKDRLIENFESKFVTEEVNGVEEDNAADKYFLKAQKEKGTDYREKYIDSLEKDKKIYQDLLIANLTELLRAQRYDRAQLTTLLAVTSRTLAAVEKKDVEVVFEEGNYIRNGRRLSLAITTGAFFPSLFYFLYSSNSIPSKAD